MWVCDMDRIELAVSRPNVKGNVLTGVQRGDGYRSGEFLGVARYVARLIEAVRPHVQLYARDFLLARI